MTLEELIAQFRTDAKDKSIAGASGQHYLFPDDDVTLWLNEAQEEAALRANLLFEATDAELCEITVTAGQAVYDLHEAVFQVTRATFTATGDTDPVTLKLTDRTEQDRTRSGWRTLTDAPLELIVDDTTVQLGCLPVADGVLNIECYRAPLDKLAQDNDIPEIGRAHHRFLPLWAVHRAFSQPDSETIDATKADTAEKAFTRQFGPRPDADRRRSLHANVPAHNKSVW